MRVPTTEMRRLEFHMEEVLKAYQQMIDELSGDVRVCNDPYEYTPDVPELNSLLNMLTEISQSEDWAY